MGHLPPLIFDLTVILAAAAVSTLIFSKLRQPVVLGYLIAGFTVGPHFPLLPTVVDNEGVKLWAEIGVIFLLFGLGLEFSFKKLAKVGKSAFIAAIFEIITMSAVGFLVGQVLGWTTMDSIYLGAILSMSSTTIIIRAFDEAGLKGKAFASLVFGILIVEDLMAILMMVILTAISVPGSFSGPKLLFLSARMIFFLLLWFLVGIYLLPSLLHRLRKLLTNEILLVFSIGLCFLMVVLSTHADFSAALGAFIMGSILSETEAGERIEHLMAPVKDLFGAIFFVSVGMMIDPGVLREHFGVIFLITILTVVGKLLGSGFGAVLSGRSLKHSTQAGMSLAQIGEFSFIIASLGTDLKVVSNFLYPIVIAVSAVTTFTTPYLIRYSDPLYSWIEKRLPPNLLKGLVQYEKVMSTPGKENAGKLLWKTYGPLILLNSVVVLAIGLASATFALPFLIKTFGDGPLLRFLACTFVLAACSPFLFAIVIRAPKRISHEPTPNILHLTNLQFGIVFFRFLIGLALIEIIISQFATTQLLPLAVLIVTPFLLYFFRDSFEKFYTIVEGRFLQNLNAKELAEINSLAKLPQLSPWNANLVQVKMSSDSPIAGQTLEGCKFRTHTGAIVAMIDRGRQRIFAPGKLDKLLPNDEIYLIGTEEQITAAQKLIRPVEIKDDLTPDELYNLESFLVEENSPFANKTIRDSGLGEEFSSTIVGIEREDRRILNPENSMILRPGDLLWIFGNRRKIKMLKKEQQKL